MLLELAIFRLKLTHFGIFRTKNGRIPNSCLETLKINTKAIRSRSAKKYNQRNCLVEVVTKRRCSQALYQKWLKVYPLNQRPQEPQVSQMRLQLLLLWWPKL